MLNIRKVLDSEKKMLELLIFAILFSMNTEDLIAELSQSRKKLIYISGKTSTGKTTLANKVQDGLNYSIVSLDKLVRESIVEKFKVEDVPQAYVVAYRDSEPAEWRESFISHSKSVIDSKIDGGVILEGAVANPKTLKDIVLEHAGDFIFLYIHPDNLDKYIARIRQRFIEGAATNTSGLPKDFWPLLPEGELETFKEENKVTADIEKAIQEFAEKSQFESEKRLTAMQEYFQNIKVINLLD
jgi:shikimate kinase